jgi:hypothetical protein
MVYPTGTIVQNTFIGVDRFKNNILNLHAPQPLDRIIDYLQIYHYNGSDMIKTANITNNTISVNFTTYTAGYVGVSSPLLY